MNPMLNRYDIIYCYTHKQAIEDGILIDVTVTAQEAGFNWPVAISSAVWYRWEILLKHEYCKRRHLWEMLVALLY